MATLPDTTPTNDDDDIPALRPGAKVGRYTLLRPIGRGGMAQVWAARIVGARGFSKIVALKTILPEYSDNPEYARMFLDEANVAAAIHHPNACGVFELGRDEGILYMAMEWILGDSLAALLRAGGERRALDIPVACRVVADACAGLHAVHEAKDESGKLLNVIHRDISPHNILLALDGQVKVADFGVAKARDQLHEKTKTGQLKGKVAYVAPERLLGRNVDRRSDLFSMGCVLYQTLLGRRPFGREDDLATLRSIVKGTYERPREVDKEFPQQLHDIVVKSLEVDPNNRFQTADAMRVALESFLAKSNKLASQSHTAATMKERLGDAIVRRRDEIREASKKLVPGASADHSGEWGTSGSRNLGTTGSHSSSGQSVNEAVPASVPSAMGSNSSASRQIAAPRNAAPSSASVEVKGGPRNPSTRPERRSSAPRESDRGDLSQMPWGRYWPFLAMVLGAALAYWLGAVLVK